MLCWHFRQWIYLTNSCSAAFCSLNGRLAGCAFILKCFSHCCMIFAFRLCHQSFSVPKILFIQHIFNLITPLQWILNQLERRTMQQKRQNRKNNAKNHKKCMETIWNKMELKRKRTHGGPKVVNFHSCSVNIEQSHLWGWLYLSLSQSLGSAFAIYSCRWTRAVDNWIKNWISWDRWTLSNWCIYDNFFAALIHSTQPVKISLISTCFCCI